MNVSNLRKHKSCQITYDFLKRKYVRMWGRMMIGISRSLIWSKTLMELIFNTCGEFRWSLEGPVSQMHFPHLHDGAPGIFLDLLRSVQMLKREWGAESNRKLPHLFMCGKTATLVPEFAVEVLPLGSTAALVPAFAVKDLPLGRTATLVPAFAVRDLPLGRILMMMLNGMSRI